MDPLKEPFKLPQNLKGTCPWPQADFNFGQFLQAENLPASLFTVRPEKSIRGEV